ncbi:hypothetical protein ABBQ38_001055 [Trebouxia sp. C0009 RCD-2024]
MSAADDLFDDEVDIGETPAAGIFDESDDEQAPAASVPAPPQAPKPKTNKLAELANKKRKEMAAAEAAAQDPHPSGKKRRRQQEASPEAELPGEAPADAAADVFGDQNSDEDPVEAPRTAEDEAFIDDEGAEPAEDVFGDNEEGEGMGDMLEAAEDDDEIDRMLNKKKRRGRDQSVHDIRTTVDAFLARMEAAAESDMTANSKNLPAIHKLRMLPDVQDMLSNQSIHNEFLDGGLLGVFKAWIEPMPDGSLPNIAVRTAVLRVLAQLPIDISYEGRKEQLKKRIARELVERWSRPIFDQYREHDSEALKEQYNEELAKARQRRQLKEAKAAAALTAGNDDEQRKAPAPGDPDFRWHASIPERATLDYIKQPQSKIAADILPTGKAAKSALMRKLMKKKTAGAGRAAKVSVEGRGIML